MSPMHVCRNFWTRCLVAGLLALTSGGWCADAPAAKAPEHPAVQLLRVPLPISGEVDTRVKGMIEQLLTSWAGQSERPILVLEFRETDAASSAASEFERALSLARYLAGERLNRVRTIAWLTGPVHGHAVLPVLACEEIIAHPEAELGQAGRDEAFVDATVRGGYAETAERRRTIPAAVVLGMLDKQAAVYRVQTDQGTRYVLDAELDELKKQAVVRSVEKIKPEGELGVVSGNALRLEYGFASHLARDRGELATALRLPPAAIEIDPALGEGRRAVRVDVDGPIRSEVVTWVERSLREKIDGEGINFVVLTLDSPGGSTEDSLRLASYLASLDPGQVRTLAFVAAEARADAALIALACDQLIVTPKAVVGGPGARRIGDQDLADLREPLRQLAADKGRNWSPAAALLDPAVKIRAYQRQGTGEVRYFCDEELAEQKPPDVWQPGEALDTHAGVRGAELVEAGWARFTVTDWEDLRRTYHLESDLPSVRPNWAHVVIEFLASPKIAGTLLFIGWFALMLEFASPGLSVAGFTSAVCFVLFFWANFLHGTAGWLEILLFATGVVCLIMELLVLPGFGAFGIGGGLLVIVSLVLASQTFVIPRNAYEWAQLPSSLFMAVAAGGGVFAALVFARHVLKDAPVFRRVSLETPNDEQLEQLRYREALVHRDYLLGKRGVTMTQLVPSGKARFGDEIVDVLSEGDVIPRGADVCVVAVEGNEVMVRAADARVA